MRGRAAGLMISVKEKKQTNLQKLIETIEQKTTEEMDTDNKLQHKYVFMYAFMSRLSKQGSFQHHLGFGDFGWSTCKPWMFT